MTLFCLFMQNTLILGKNECIPSFPQEMNSLNPITAYYLKILEVVSVIMVAVGEKLDSLFSSQRLAAEHSRRLRHQPPWWPDDDQRSDFQQWHSSSDSESIDSGLPDYYFNQFDPRSPFCEPFPDSYDWHDSFTDPDIHHDRDPFDSY